MSCTLTGISLITPDVIRLRAFYERVLQVEGEGDARHVEMHTTGAGLTLFSWQGMEEMAPGSMTGAGHGGTIVGFEVADVDAEDARLRALGVPIVKPPQTYPWGTRSVWFRDPDGNLVNFFARVTP
jgi:catechol 2,3-dioxygenase-like lactoylglutathione lyase family enzyme